MRRGRERAVAAAAAAAGLAVGLEPYPAAAMGPGFLAGAIPGSFPIRVSRVSDDCPIFCALSGSDDIFSLYVCNSKN